MAASLRIGHHYPARARRFFTRTLGSSWYVSNSSIGAAASFVRDLTRAQTPAEALMSTHARTFSFAARFLPEPQRSETINLYAFFRTLDDLVDESLQDAPSRAIIERELDAWEQWIADGFVGYAPRPIVADPLPGIIERRGVPQVYLLDFVAGLKSDLDPSEPANRAEVELYSYQVASTVGLSLTHIFGATTRRALIAARHMGIAMQLTNILRDIGGDLARGRFYLPATVLEAHGVSRSEIDCMWRGGTGPDDRLRNVIREIVTWADEHYAAGESGISLLPEDVRVPISISSRLYQRILRELEQNEYDSLRIRVSTSTWQKLAEAYRCALNLACPDDQARSTSYELIHRQRDISE